MEDVSLITTRNYAENIYYLNTQFNGFVNGVDAHYLSVYGYQVKSGRGFTQQDYDKCRKVILVDDTAAKSIFSGENPVGKPMEIQGDVYTVVGVIAQSEEFAPTINSMRDYNLYMNNSGGAIYLPSTTWPTGYRFDEPQSVAIKVVHAVVATTAMMMTNILNASCFIF